MKILDRYLLREFLLYCALGVLAFSALFIIIDLFEKLDVFVDHHAPLPTVLRYYAYGFSSILTLILPIALLLGSLLSLTALRKYNEIQAMQGSGQSPWRLARPLLTAALAVSLGQYAMNESFEARHFVEQRRILNEEIKKLSGMDQESRTDVRLLGGGSRVYVAQFYDARHKILRNVSVQFLSHRTLTQRADAERAIYRDGTWRFENGYYRSFADSGVTVLPFRAYASSQIEEEPSDFVRRQQDPFHMGMKDLWRYARRLEESGGEAQKYLTNFHLRASFPLANLVMVLLGTSLSLRILRGSNLALGFGLSVTIGFAYLALLRTGQAFGYNGTLPPALAAWLGNLIFGALGSFFFWRVSR